MQAARARLPNNPRSIRLELKTLENANNELNKKLVAAREAEIEAANGEEEVRLHPLSHCPNALSDHGVQIGKVLKEAQHAFKHWSKELDKVVSEFQVRVVCKVKLWSRLILW